jgi:hypothetical protein
MKRVHEHPECFEPEKDYPYPLCVGSEKSECMKCQLRANWEPEDPYGFESRYSNHRI